MNIFTKCKIVVICGGKGTRLNPITGDIAKSLVLVNGRPILDYIIEYWSQFSRNFVFVLGYKAEDIVNHVRSLPIEAEFIVEDKPGGIAKAIEMAQGYVSDRFVVVLGDCLVKGEFSFPAHLEQGCGVWVTKNPEDIKQSYSVLIKNGLICQLKEKPQQIINNLCGMGFYFFDSHVFRFIEQSKPTSLKNQIEITNVMQDMIDAGLHLQAVMFSGQYLNVTYPDDLKKAEQLVGG